MVPAAARWRQTQAFTTHLPLFSAYDLGRQAAPPWRLAPLMPYTVLVMARQAVRRPAGVARSLRAEARAAICARVGGERSRRLLVREVCN